MSQSTIKGDGRYMGMQSSSRGNFRGGNSHKFKQTEPNWPLGKLVKVINIADLSNLGPTPNIERCEYVASYNWLEYGKQPTILVPGSPPLWSPSSQKQLKEDSGEYFRDSNAARYPGCPTEPTFRALLAMHPDFDMSALHVVGCGSTLGNLLRFCKGIKKDFRFNIDLVGDTVFFIRKESSPAVLIPDIRGYGHTFPEAHTIWEPEVKGSASHQRIVQYDFGGLKFMVRSESDGYLKQEAELDAKDAVATNSPKSMVIEAQIQDDTSTLFDALTMTGERSASAGPLQVKLGSRSIPQKAIFDLKTRAEETCRPIDMDEVYRRLWVNQTPYFMFAEHFRGSFEPRSIQPMPTSEGMTTWESTHAALLKQYQAVIMEIINATKSSATGKLQVIRKAAGPLEIQERVAGDDADVLPQDLRSRWGTI